MVLALCAIFAPWIAPFDPTETDVGPRLGAPDAMYWFGVDLHGRDMFSRIVWGGRYSLAVGMATVILAREKKKAPGAKGRLEWEETAVRGDRRR